MSDENNETPESQENEQKPPADWQGELNRIAGQSRQEGRDRLLKDLGYKDVASLKSALKSADDAKSAEQKANERLEALEREMEQTKLSALRSRIQARFSMADEDAELFLTASDEDGLVAQAKRVAALKEEAAEADKTRKKSGPVVLKEGQKPNTPADDELRGLTNQLFGRE